MTVETDTTQETNARTANKMQKDKNRNGADLPGDAHRVRLSFNRDSERTIDYINAVYLNSFVKIDHFIVAQTPLVNGVLDFLTMILQDDCSCIVSLEEIEQCKNVGLYLPAENTHLVVGNFTVTCKQLETHQSYVTSKLQIIFQGKYQTLEKTVYHFQYKDWENGTKVPANAKTFLEFTREVESFASQRSTKGSCVLVHCLNAYERGCLYCAVVTLTEKIVVEGELCVVNVLRQLRSRRKLAIPNVEQLQFCFQAVSTFIGMNNTTKTVDESAYTNIANNHS